MGVEGLERREGVMVVNLTFLCPRWICFNSLLRNLSNRLRCGRHGRISASSIPAQKINKFKKNVLPQIAVRSFRRRLGIIDDGASSGEYAITTSAHVDAMRSLRDTARIRAAFPGADRSLLASVLRLQQDLARPTPRCEGQGGETQDWYRSVSHAVFLSRSLAEEMGWTDEKPLDMAFYDLLALPATASQEEIKKAYRRLVRCSLPDRLAQTRD